MNNNVLSELTDVMLRLKAGIEQKSASAIRPLLTENAQVNVNGRFYTPVQLTGNMQAILDRMDQPSLDILSIEESEIRDGEAFVTYATEFFWIDEEIWEEHSLPALVTLHLVRPKETATRGGWMVQGFSFQQQRPKAVPSHAKDPDRLPTPGVGVAGAHGGTHGGDGGTSNLFNFWY